MKKSGRTANVAPINAYGAPLFSPTAMRLRNFWVRFKCAKPVGLAKAAECGHIYASGGPPLFDRKIAGTKLSNKFESLDQILWLIDWLPARADKEGGGACLTCRTCQTSVANFPAHPAIELNKSPEICYFSKCRKESYLVNIQIYAPHKFEFELRAESRRLHMVTPEFGHWQGAHDECQGASRAWGTEDCRRGAATQLIWDLSALLVSVPRARRGAHNTAFHGLLTLLYWLARARRGCLTQTLAAARSRSVSLCCYERTRGNEAPSSPPQPPRSPLPKSALYNVVSALAAEDKWLNSSLAVLCVALWKIMDPPRLSVSDIVCRFAAAEEFCD
jgi:hypothetical protein